MMTMRLAAVSALALGIGGCALIDGIGGGATDSSIGDGGAADAPTTAGTPDGAGLAEFPLRFHGDFSAGAKPVALAVGNHPEPGNVWIASVNETASQVTMLSRDMANPGDIVFREALTVGSEPIEAVMADFSGDGLDDVAVACRGSEEVYVFFQTGGTPAFTAPVVLAVADQTFAIAAGDFNDDDAIDVAISGAGGLGPTAFMRGADPTSFGSAVVLDSYPSGSAIAAADVDGDGLDDIAGGEGMFILFYQDAPSYVVGEIDGGLQFQKIAMTTLDPGRPIAILVGGTDGLSAWERDTIDHRRLIKRGTLPSAPGIADIATGQLSAGDDHTDVVTVGSQITLCMRENASVVPTSVHNVGGSTMRSAVAVVDLDGDDRDDIVVANPALATVSVFLNDR